MKNKNNFPLKLFPLLKTFSQNCFYSKHFFFFKNSFFSKNKVLSPEEGRPYYQVHIYGYM